MDEMLTRVIEGAPNFVFALLFVWWLMRRFDRVLDMHEQLLRQCFDAEPPGQGQSD